MRVRFIASLFLLARFLLILTPAAGQEPLQQAEAQVSPQPVDSLAGPVVAADRLGNTVVIWRARLASTTVLFRQRYDSTGQPIGVAQAIANTGPRPISPQVGFDDAGRATVIWDDEPGFRLAGQRYDADGQPLGGVFTIATFACSIFSPAALAVTADGSFVVAWAEPETHALQARRVSAEGVPLGGVLPLSNTGQLPTAIDIVARHDGRFAVSWIEQPTGLPRRYASFIRFFDAAGQPASDVLALGTSPPPFLEAHGGGLSADEAEVVVAYAAAEAILFERFTWSGASLGPAVTVSVTADRNQHSPSIVRVATGESLVVWISERHFRFTAPFSRLMGRWLEADGSPRGTAFWMSPALASSITASAVAADGLGQAVVAHHYVTEPDFSGHVYARRLRPDAPAGTLQLQPASAQRFEGDTHAPLTVVRSGGSAGTVAVRYRLAAGSATADSDYLSQDGVITFADGETGAKSAAVILRDDDEVEADETLTGTLFDATGGAALVGATTATITLVDDDLPSPRLAPASTLPPFAITPAKPNFHRLPAAASHSSGMHAVAWLERDAFTSTNTVYARRFDHQGRPLGDSIPLGAVEIAEDLEYLNNRPALSFDAAGGFLVVWGPDELWGRYVDPAGVPAAGPFAINTCPPHAATCVTYPHEPSVVTVGPDTFAVVWNDRLLITIPDPNTIAFQLVDRLGAEHGERMVVRDGTFGACAVGYADGSFIIVWEQYVQDGLFAQRFDAHGVPLHAPITLLAQTASQPAVASGRGTRTFVAYRGASGLNGLFLDGDTIGEPFLISTAAIDFLRPAAVALDGEGNAIAAWGDRGQEDVGPGIYARRISAAGQPLGTDRRVMATRHGGQRDVALTAGPTGDILAVWKSSTFSHDNDILGRMLPTGRCHSDARVLCLGDDRFLVEVAWEDFEGRQGHGQAVGLTPDTGAFWFFDDANLELVVKVLDGRPNNGHYWVFYGALSNVAFDLKVTDLDTGAVARYNNPLGTFASVGDITALPAFATSAPAGAAPPEAKRLLDTGAFASFPARPGKGSCVPDTITLCLNDGRFAVTALLTDPTLIPAQARPQTDDTGTFWFFDEDNIELIIKVLDGTAANDHYWLFYGALSNVGYTVTVTDTVTGVTKTYNNPNGTFASVGDTTALPDTGP